MHTAAIIMMLGVQIPLLIFVTCFYIRIFRSDKKSKSPSQSDDK